MSRGRPRQPVSEDRLMRKRLAAKLRQRRCRERKKGSAQMGTKPENVSGTTKVDSAIHALSKETSSAPASSPCKMKIVHVPVPAYFGIPPYHRHPMYMPHPMSIPPSHHQNHRPFHPIAHPRYVHHSHYHHPGYQMMPHRHHSIIPKTSYTAATTSAQSDTIPRTVSRSSSDVSADNSTGTSDVSLNALNKKKRKKSLASEEKTAVAAILSLKSNSSDEDSSSDETISTSDGIVSLASEIDDHSGIIQRVDNAESVFRTVSV